MSFSNNKPSPKKASLHPKNPKNKESEMTVGICQRQSFSDLASLEAVFYKEQTRITPALSKETEQYSLSAIETEPETIGLPQSTTAFYRLKTEKDELAIYTENEDLRRTVRDLKDDFGKLVARLEEERADFRKLVTRLEEERAEAASDQKMLFQWEVLARMQSAIYAVMYQDALASTADNITLRSAGIDSLSSFRTALSDDFGSLNPLANVTARGFVANHYSPSIEQLLRAVKDEWRRLRGAPRSRNTIAHPMVKKEDMDDTIANFGIEVESDFLSRMKVVQDPYHGYLFD